MSHRLEKEQQGAVLIVSMLLLVVLSLLSISAMNSSAMQERISGHLRDSQLAFEAADAALRDTEQWLGAQTQLPTPCSNLTGGCQLFVSAPLDALDGDDGRPWWAEVEADWWQQYGFDFITAMQELPHSASDPYTIIEEVERVPDSLVVGVAPQGSRVYYRITSRGVGATPWAESIVQSTFVKQDH